MENIDPANKLTNVLECAQLLEDTKISTETNGTNESVQLISLEEVKSCITSTDRDFYGKARKYWSNVPATVNGMLGGLGSISAIDIQGSSDFLRELRIPVNKHALDCGAGIGRVSKYLLMPRFTTVDLVEQDAKFSQKAREYCNLGVSNSKLGEVYNQGLQDFCPATGKYNLIWSQWVLGHLTDDDLIAFFRRVRVGLSKNGYFVIKENITSRDTEEKDEEDSSLTRPLKTYEILLKEAGFRIVKSLRQQNFPKGLYPVYMIACRPINIEIKE